MKYTEEFTVSSHDVDVNNNLRPSLVLRYMQETANHQMRDRKPSYYDFFFQGKSFIVTRISIQIYEAAGQYDDIKVSTWKCGNKGATFLRSYSIEKDGKVLAEAFSAWAVVDTETHKLYRSSDIDISNYEEDEPINLDLPSRFRLPANLDYKKVGEKSIFYSDVDMNLHMNNTNYPDMLVNYIPDMIKKEVTSVNLRFMTEARLGEKLSIYMAKDDFSAKVDKRRDELYCFRTSLGEKTNIEAQIGVRNL